MIGIGGSRPDFCGLHDSYKEAADVVYSINIMLPEKVLNIKDAGGRKEPQYI